MIKFIIHCNCFDTIELTFFEPVQNIRKLFISNKNLTTDRICKVCNMENNNCLFISDFSSLKKCNLAMNYNFTNFIIDIFNFH